MERAAVLAALAAHTPFDGAEAAHRERLRAFVASADAPFSRSQRDGHVTGSAVLLDATGSRMLLLWHTKLSRWLHIYGSMASFAIVLFFSLTGITVNHQDWFADQQVTSQGRGTVPAASLHTKDAPGVDKLDIVESLRRTHGIRGALSDLRVDETQVDVAFKGPGYAADVVIDRATGQYELTEVKMGFWALVNDLHKGRDTGDAWRVLIDISAGVLVFISLTGLILLYFIHKHRTAGAVLIVVGAVLSYGVYQIFVP